MRMFNNNVRKLVKCDFCHKNKVKKARFKANSICRECYCWNSIDFKNAMFFPIMALAVIFGLITIIAKITGLQEIYNLTSGIAIATSLSIPAFIIISLIQFIQYKDILEKQD